MKKLLIVEDEELQASAFRIGLGKVYDVTIAKNGTDAFDKLKQLVPDLIILDVVLPGPWNGFEILRQLKAHPVAKNIPVMVLTNLDKEHEKEAMDLGAIEYLMKTETSLDALEEKVRQHVGM